LKASRRIAAASSQSSLLEEPPPALPLHPFLRSEEDSISVLHPDEFSPEKIFARLQEGQEVGLEKSWRWDQALRLYGALKREVEKHYGTPRSFHEDLQLRAIRHEILSRLWVLIQEGKVQIRGAPPLAFQHIWKPAWMAPVFGCSWAKRGLAMVLTGHPLSVSLLDTAPVVRGLLSNPMGTSGIAGQLVEPVAGKGTRGGRLRPGLRMRSAQSLPVQTFTPPHDDLGHGP